MPPLEVWIKVKNWYPIGTMIKREFVKDSGVIYDATVTDIDIETKRYKLKWDDDNEFLEKEDTYTGQQIGNIFISRRNVQIQSRRDSQKNV